MKQIVNITIRRHHAIPFKILKRFADILLIILLLTVTFSVITPTPVHAQDIEEVVLYEENFNDNQAHGWELDHGWTVTEGILSGRGYDGWARCTAGEWSDYRVKFRLQLLEEGSEINLNYRLSEKGRYFIGFHEGGLSLSKEDPWGTFHEILAKSSVSNGYYGWHNVEIIGEGPRIQVAVDGKLELNYTDPEPLISGTIAFETFGGAVAQVDDIIVIGPSPTQKGPDLAIQSTVYRFEDDERVLVLIVKIVNHGFSEAPETQVFVEDIEHDWLNEIRLIPALGPKETISVEIRKDIPEKLRGTMRIFRVEVDPEDTIREIYEENNAMTREIQPTPAPTVIPTPDGNNNELLQIIGLILIISGLLFTALTTLKKDIIFEIGIPEGNLKYIGSSGILLIIIGSYILLKCYELI
ncbi:MAG: family 16 glycoside hydrolase [Euryarchaeota archaeon]|nr:family 16 glycoside hydrolase [Euryarchaeota archaeon]